MYWSLESNYTACILSLSSQVRDLLNHCTNKCIGDNTKAAARQSLNCIKNKKNKIKYGEKRFLPRDAYA